MRKKLLFVLASVLSLGLVAGCGSKESASGDASGEAAAIEYSALDYVTLGDYMNLSIETTQYMVYDSDVEEAIQNVLNNNTYHKELDKTTVEEGDYIELDYTLTKDGEEVQSSSMDMVVGAGSVIDDFDKGVTGATVGEEFSFEATFPEDYAATDLAGQTTTFTVTVTGIFEEEESVPELTDAWVEENFGETLEVTTVEGLTEEIREYLQTNADNNTESELLSNLQTALYECCTVNAIPEGLLEQKIQLVKDSVSEAATSAGYEYSDYITQGMGYATEEDFDAYLTEYVTDYVNQLLVRQAICEKEGWEVTDDLKDEALLLYAQNYGYETFDEFLEAFGEANGFSTKDEFIDIVGADEFNDYALTIKLQNAIRESASINYVVQEDDAVDASGDATEE